MKFLFDQSADFRLILHLRQLGHDVQAVSRNYPPGLPDEDVLEIARKEKRILIVVDRDFGELIFHQGLAHASFSFGSQEQNCKPRSINSIPCLRSTLTISSVASS
jgi:predicted nuclease of predicted toxin-antitoxin system